MGGSHTEVAVSHGDRKGGRWGRRAATAGGRQVVIKESPDSAMAKSEMAQARRAVAMQGRGTGRGRGQGQGRGRGRGRGDGSAGPTGPGAAVGWEDRCKQAQR